ncbi:MAG: STAS-like domain-containing protein [Myxococcota bacterium]
MERVDVKIAERFGTHLSSRSRAAELRAQLELESRPTRTELDFHGVVLVSTSFADELIGVLSQERGLNWLRDHVGVRGASDEVLQVLLEAIAGRTGRAA